MDKERLTNYFDKMSPSESQKMRMKKTIISHRKKQESPSKYAKGWSFSTISKVVASVVFALIILGNIPLVGKATAELMSWFHNYYETMLDIVEKQEHLEITSDFSTEKHEKYAEMYRYRGLSEERAEEEAFHAQLSEIAIINKAIDLGFYVSIEEAKQKARETFGEWEEWREYEDVVTITDNANMVKNMIEDLRKPDDEFWNEHILFSNAFMLMREEVLDYEMKENPTKNWNELERDIIMDFILSEAQQINEYKKEIGLE
ncbi:hypothetical protein [Bacillus alkalicellulosilyticus]|uniref:hypothetical protein n=1 Tax=Alkalihalobacterium alkalicellulosilyticum TaxID=1912214 RepID=UPI000996B40E|nr:hypothetical protein [Bacillus alkalicellulosilyticus]